MGIEINKETIKTFLEGKGKRNIVFRNDKLKNWETIVGYDKEVFGEIKKNYEKCKTTELFYLKQKFQVDKLGTVSFENTSRDAIQAMFDGLKPRFEKRGDYHGYRGHGKYLYHKGNEKEENELILFLL